MYCKIDSDGFCVFRFKFTCCGQQTGIFGISLQPYFAIIAAGLTLRFLGVRLRGGITSYVLHGDSVDFAGTL